MGVSTIEYNIFVTNSFAFSKNLRLFFYSVYIQIVYFQSKFIMRIWYFEVNIIINSLLITNQNCVKRYYFFTTFQFRSLTKNKHNVQKYKTFLLLPLCYLFNLVWFYNLTSESFSYVLYYFNCGKLILLLFRIRANNYVTY